MMNKMLLMGLAVSLAIPSLRAQETVQVDRKPMSGGIALEFGHIFDGQIIDRNEAIPLTTMHRTVGWLVQEATINHRLDIKVGIGGVFFYFFPEVKGFRHTHERTSAVSLAQASGTYNWGEPENPDRGLPLRDLHGRVGHRRQRL